MTNINENEIHYKIIGESSDGKVRQYYWSITVGLNEVDNLHLSQYFKTLIENNIKGKYSYKEVGN